MSDNPAEKMAKTLEKDLRDPALHPAPAAVKTHPGSAPTNSQMDGKEQVEKTETGTLWPKDDTPWNLEKKSGPVSGTVTGGTLGSQSTQIDTAASQTGAPGRPDKANEKVASSNPASPAPGDEGVQPN